jgi:16S rRNA (adenine1518-N6/adenine1519-N6)-dimethyltransferase
MRKKLGQNFLVNPGVRRTLLDALELPPGEEVWEVGPGLGAMTGGLLERGGRVRAFELDPGFIRLLREIFGKRPDFSLVEGDVLKTWRGAEGAPYFLGNLPYHIAAALLADLIEGNRFFRRMVVTVQREVAQRMGARPGSPDYSSFSVLCASAYRVTLLQVIRGSSFYPAPRVDSPGVRLDLQTGGEPPSPLLRPLVRRLFADRRKTVKNNLRGFIAGGLMVHTGAGGEIAAEALRAAGIGPERRAETLSLEEFAALARSLEGLSQGGGESLLLYGRKRGLHENPD